MAYQGATVTVPLQILLRKLRNMSVSPTSLITKYSTAIQMNNEDSTKKSELKGLMLIDAIPVSRMPILIGEVWLIKGWQKSSF